MATAFSIDKYRDPEKIDLSSTFQAQAYKQQNYDINTAQTQQLINQYAGTDLLRDIDKEYFGERLNTLVGFINQSGTRDWSRKSISDKLQNYVSTALDKNVIKAIASTQSFRKQQAEIEALKVKNQALKIMNDGKNKIIEEYEHKYPDFFFMENDLMGKR